jgi:DNA adenine methylase
MIDFGGTKTQPRPFLRWAGSKKQLLPSIKQYWNGDYSRYIEPFCGSASLFFELNPPAAMLSDINEELIETLRAVQFSPAIVSECLLRMRTDEKSYYRVRAQDPGSLSSIERAARFIYLNSLCFNGLYRVNKAGQFNVPYGSQHRKNLFDASALRETSRALANTEIANRDFEASVLEAGIGDFIYLDPPYVTHEFKIFTAYDKDSFSSSDLSRLNAALLKADKRGAKFVLSYANVPEVAEFCNEWNIRVVTARRNIAGFAGSRRMVQEVLISNCEPCHE